MDSIKRLAIAIASLSILLSSAPASAGPEDDLRALLLRADNVVATGIGPSSIFVFWTDRSPVETANRIEMAPDEAGPYTQVGVAPQCTNAIADVRLDPLNGHPIEVGKVCGFEIQTGPPSDPRPKWFRVVPMIAVQGTVILEGPPSEPDPALLGAVPPSNLRCNGGGDTSCLSVNSVTLTWQDNSDEYEFWIMRARGAINPNFGTAPHAVVPANTTEFHEYLTDFSTTYYYRVIAVRQQNIPRLDQSVTVERSFSGALAVGTLLDRVKVETAPVPPPSDPTGLTVQFIPPSTARLTWTDTANQNLPYIDEDRWFIDWGGSATRFQFTQTKLPHPGQGTVVYEDDTVPPDTTRCFRVRGVRSGPAYSGYTNVACLGSIPKKPTNLVATALDNATVNLAWVDNSDAETAFAVQRCTGVCTHSSAGWTGVGTTGADVERFTDNNVVSNTTYSYRVAAENSSGRSPWSNIAPVTTPASLVLAPSNLVATATGSHEITLTWIDNALNETGFRIEFRRSGEWQTLDEVGQRSGTGSVTYVDTMSLAANERRCYRVRAVRAGKVSDPSNEDCATTLPPAAPNGAPTGLIATPISNVRLDLTWLDHASNEDAFRVEAVSFGNRDCPQNATGLPFKKVGESPKRIGTGSTTFALTGLQPHTAYFVRVIAVNKDGESDPSNVAGCVQTLGPPIPVFEDPAENGDIEATRCDVTIESPFHHGGGPSDPDQVDRMKLIVNSIVGGNSPVSHTDVLWAEAPLTSDGDGATWVFQYKFRRGVNYRLIAQSFGPQPTGYNSWSAEIRDTTVVADCPLEI